MMTASGALDRLAAFHGIEPVYTDVRQRPRKTSAETQKALLRAMGVSAHDDTAIAISLDEAEAAAWRSPLPPVLILRQPALAALDLVLPSGTVGVLRWVVQTEDGGCHQGTAVPGDLPLIERRRDCERRRLVLGLDLPLGYHRFSLPDLGTAMPLIIAPCRAFGVADVVHERKIWGLTAPLYGLRSGKNWGIGEYADLGSLASLAGAAGADVLGINPVHALFPTAPERISPYSPSSRRFLNVLHIAVEQVREWRYLPAEARAVLQASLSAIQSADLVDYPTVAEAKHRAFEALFGQFERDLSSDPSRADGLQLFIAEQGADLECHALFEALSEEVGTPSWPNWPIDLQDPNSEAVRVFGKAHPGRLRFHQYLQWQADQQLQRAQAEARAGGMALGLYLDLAIGLAPDGADAWADQAAIINDVRIGAPPDDFSPDGQNWGLVPFAPNALKADAYRPFITLLRQTMRHAGAIRIDHALGLQRSFWIPADGGAAGAYLRYPLDDLLGLIALESHRQQTVVICEDLGTVPLGLRSALDGAGLLGCSVLYFERGEAGAFKPAKDYREAAVASIGTHDLPTLPGFWACHDIGARERLGLFADDIEAGRQRLERIDDRSALLALLKAEALLPEGLDPDDPPDELPWSLVLALHRFLARTPSVLSLVQIEDMLSVLEQPNLPGTVDQYPNWRRKLPLPLERLDQESSWQDLAATMASERSR